MLNKCLQCGKVFNSILESALCIECMNKEFEKLDHGEASGYLTATKLWIELKNLTPEQKRIVKAEMKQLSEYNKFNLPSFMKIRVINGE